MLAIKVKKKKTTFNLYINDYLSFTKTLNDIYEFFHKTYFLYIDFKLVYLIDKQAFIFDDIFDILGLDGILP